MKKQYVGSGQRDSSVSAAADRGRAGSGLGAGLVVTAYRWLLQKAGEWLTAVLEFTAGSPLKMAGWFAVLLLMAWAVGKLVTWEPMISGSGIPQLEGEMSREAGSDLVEGAAGQILRRFLCLLAGFLLEGKARPFSLARWPGKLCPVWRLLESQRRSIC